VTERRTGEWRKEEEKRGKRGGTRVHNKGKKYRRIRKKSKGKAVSVTDRGGP
jgi:hypothetical protein